MVRVLRNQQKALWLGIHVDSWRMQGKLSAFVVMLLSLPCLSKRVGRQIAEFAGGWDWRESFILNWEGFAHNVSHCSWSKNELEWCVLISELLSLLELMGTLSAKMDMLFSFSAFRQFPKIGAKASVAGHFLKEEKGIQTAAILRGDER